MSARYSGTFTRYVVRMYLALFAGILAAVLAIFLVADFVDRARAYSGPHWLQDVAVLYGFKALVAIQQLGPAALLLAAGATVSTLRKRGEVTALGALAFGARALYVPVAVAALVVSLALALFDEKVVTHAGRRVDDITTLRFNRWGDWYLHFTPKQWFRRGDQVFYLRQQEQEGGFEDVTIFTLTPDFHLARRVDAERMVPLEGTRWRLSGVIERTFVDAGEGTWKRLESADYDLGVAGKAFRIQLGRPEQLRMRELAAQVEARSGLGLPTRGYVLALHNRLAYPLAGVPAALLAVALALRPGRRGHLTAALLEGMLVVFLLWSLMVVGRTLVMSEHLAAPVAAWAPVGVLVLASFAASRVRV